MQARVKLMYILYIDKIIVIRSGLYAGLQIDSYHLIL